MINFKKNRDLFSKRIFGICTTATAFIGPALRGPLNEPARIQSFEEFQRIFGGLWKKSLMSYAVMHYFLNRGEEAVVNRIHRNGKKTKILIGTQKRGLWFEALNEGEWGDRIKIVLDHKISGPTAQAYGLKKADLFNLKIYDQNNNYMEEFLNLTVVNGPRRVDHVIENQSSLVKVWGRLPDSVPCKSVTDYETESLSSEIKVPGFDGDEPTGFQYIGSVIKKTGIYAFDKIDTFNLMCIPRISLKKRDSLRL